MNSYSNFDKNLIYYILGYFYADASISKKMDSITISSSYKDLEFINKLSILFGKSMQIFNAKCNGKDYLSCKFHICGKENVKFWYDLGIVNNKTYENSDNIFKSVPKEYKWDFIRGYFDGDGTIYKQKSSYNRDKYNIGFVSANQELLRSICVFINIECNLVQTVKQDGKNFRLRYYGNRSCEKIGSKLYYKEDLFSNERKSKVFKEIPSKIVSKYYHYNKQRNVWIIDYNKFNICKHFKTEKEAKEYVQNKLKGENDEQIDSKMVA